jgi:hypothetical protein
MRHRDQLLQLTDPPPRVAPCTFVCPDHQLTESALRTPTLHVFGEIVPWGPNIRPSNHTTEHLACYGLSSRVQQYNTQEYWNYR